MAYKKLVNDLLSECPKNCADCEYSEGVEFNCTMSRMAADAITELFGKVERLKKENAELLYRVKSAETRCDTLEKLVNEYQSEIVPGYIKRAKNAERALAMMKEE